MIVRGKEFSTSIFVDLLCIGESYVFCRNQAALPELFERTIKMTDTFGNTELASLSAYADKRKAENAYLMDDYKTLERLVAQDKVVATLDIEGAPFHFPVTVTLSNNPDPAERKLILWLCPNELDHDWKIVKECGSDEKEGGE
jgi:hypothetical protein